MRPTSFVILLACALALAGCAKPVVKPVVSTGYTDKNQLIQDYVAAVQNGDTARIEAMIFKEGLSAEDLALNQENIKLGVGFAASALHLKGKPIKKIEEHFFLPGQQEELQGRPVGVAITPAWMIKVLFDANPGDLPFTMTGPNVTQRISLTLPIIVRDGKHWICPIAYLASSSSATAPVALPFGIELSKSAEVSIVRLQEKLNVAWGFNWSYSSGSQDLIDQVDGQRCQLSQTLMDFHPETGWWFRGMDNLPQGFFKVEVKNLPQSRTQLNQHLQEAYALSFGLKFTDEDYEWDGWLITAPSALPAIFKKSTVDNHGSNTAKEGYAFRGCLIDEIAARIENRLNAPVEIKHPFGEQPYDFTIPCDFTDDDALLYGLKELGFKIEPKKLIRKTTVITRAK